jgi:hypothetical protein
LEAEASFKLLESFLSKQMNRDFFLQFIPKSSVKISLTVLGLIPSFRESSLCVGGMRLLTAPASLLMSDTVRTTGVPEFLHTLGFTVLPLIFFGSQPAHVERS